MKQLYTRMIQIYRIYFTIIIILSIVCYIGFRRIHFPFFVAFILMILIELIACMMVLVFRQLSFIKICNTTTIEMFQTCQIEAYILTYIDFLKQVPNLLEPMKAIVQTQLANAYRYQGNYAQALFLYEQLEQKKKKDIVLYQLYIYKLSIYVGMEDIEHCNELLHILHTSPIKERFFRLKQMQPLRQDLQVLETYVNYLNKEVSTDICLKAIRNGREEYLLFKLLKLKRILRVLYRENREEEARKYEAELLKIKGNSTMFDKDFIIQNEGNV